MVTSVLRSQTAVGVNIKIMRAFTAIPQSVNNAQMIQRIFNIGQLQIRNKKDAEIRKLQERLGKAESEAIRSGNKAYSEHQRAENAEQLGRNEEKDWLGNVR